MTTASGIDSGRARVHWLCRYYFVPEAITLMIAAPMLWWAFFDHVPPQVRLLGQVVPVMARAGEPIQIIWTTTRRQRSCPGSVQVEFWDAERNLFPKLGKLTNAIYRDDPDDPDRGELIPPPIAVPRQALGPMTVRITTFWYCNWLQKLLDMPIVQVGPDLKFYAQPREEGP